MGTCRSTGSAQRSTSVSSLSPRLHAGTVFRRTEYTGAALSVCGAAQLQRGCTRASAPLPRRRGYHQASGLHHRAGACLLYISCSSECAPHCRYPTHGPGSRAASRRVEPAPRPKAETAFKAVRGPTQGLPRGGNGAQEQEQEIAAMAALDPHVSVADINASALAPRNIVIASIFGRETQSVGG